MAMKVGVLGAGVVGLNTALKLQDEYPQCEIDIIADKFMKMTLSDGAAGIFRPDATFRGPTPDITMKWMSDAYNYYQDILQSSDAVSAGVKEVSVYMLAHQLAHLVQNKFLENLCPNFRPMTSQELKICPGDWNHGSFYTTMVIGCPHYLPWATRKFCHRGGRIMNKIVDDLVDLASHYDVLFNCSGFNARYLCHDEQVIPLKGQIIKVKAPWIKMAYYADSDTYIIPGMDHVSLGGCRLWGNYIPGEDLHMARSIWDRCTTLVPSLSKAEIVEHWCGFRPFRHIVRVEKEAIYNDGKMVKIVHNYGHGGFGVTTSPGTASYAVKLLGEMLHGNYENPVQTKL